MEPRLARCGVVPWDDRFVANVCNVTTEPCDLLHEPLLGVGHQFLIAPIPQLVVMRERTGDTTAVGLDGVSRDEFRVEWRQVAMPVNDPEPVVIDRGVHMPPSLDG